MKRATIVMFLVAVACSKDNPSTPSPSPTPTPTPPVASTFTLSGRVTETAPTTNTGIGGARVTFNDGPNTGRFATADANGNYTFTGLLGGNANPNATATNYLDQARGLALTANATLNFTLAPAPRIIDETLTGTVSGGDPTCFGGSFTRPCRILTIPLHHNGVIDATLTWNGTADLDLGLFRAGSSSVIASSPGVRGTERVSASVTGGSNYELRISYYEGSTVATYFLRLIHPN